MIGVALDEATELYSKVLLWWCDDVDENPSPKAPVEFPANVLLAVVPNPALDIFEGVEENASPTRPLEFPENALLLAPPKPVFEVVEAHGSTGELLGTAAVFVVAQGFANEDEIF